jgi:L-lactate utilization protein LutC
MTDGRDALLATVRAAVAAGNQAGRVPALPTGRRVGYQGAGPNAVTRFAEELRNAGGQCHVVSQHEEAIQRVVESAMRANANKAVLGKSDLLTRLRLATALHERGVETWEESAAPPQNSKGVLFAADVGITGVDALIAETGSIVLASRPGQARSPSLLPPVHIAVAERSQLVPDLFDMFDLQFRPENPIPSCLTIITGPSKTGDIELRLVTGVHGPREVHVVLIDS